MTGKRSRPVAHHRSCKCSGNQNEKEKEKEIAIEMV
jgi:hypothetical protein